MTHLHDGRTAPHPDTDPIPPHATRRGPTITAIAEPPVITGHHDVQRAQQETLSLLGLASRHRISLVVLVLLGLLGGLAAGYLSPVKYTAQAQLLAGATSVGAAAVPSFAEAGESLAQTYSRVFAGDRVKREMVADGFDPATETVTASPVAGSSVILIEAQAPNAAAADRAANAGVKALTSTVAELLDNSSLIATTRASLRAAYAQQAQAEAARAALEKHKTSHTAASYVTATADLGSAQATVGAARQLLADQVSASVQANGVAPLSTAAVSSTTSAQRYELWGSIGLIAGLLLWLVLAFLRSRPLRRRPAPIRRTTA